MKNKKIALTTLVAAMLLVGCAGNKSSESSNSVSNESVISTSSDNSENSSVSSSTGSETSSTSVTSTPVVVDSYTGTYYNSISSTATGSALLDSLHDLIDGHNEVGYNGLWNAYEKTDKVPGQNYYYDIYSNYHYTKNSPHNYSSEGTGFNREHTTPQSWWGGGTGPAQGNDLFNVYPTDGKVNGVRSNYPYGEVGNATYTSSNGCKLGTSNFGSMHSTVFEVTDEYKGDIARTMFYMVTRYDQRSNTFNKGEGGSTYKNTFPYLTDYAVKLFTKWSEQDPVSEKEIRRNEAVYKLQNNRNPFIDHPSYIAKIFGTYGATPSPVTPTPVTPTPAVADYEMVNDVEVNKTYKLGMNNGKDLFFTGNVDSADRPWYLQTSDSFGQGIDVTLETKDSGYAIAFTVLGTKKYINGYKSGKHYSIELRTTSDTVWSYDATNKTMTCDIEGTKCFLGTHDTFVTISMNQFSKLSTSYPCHFYIAK